jgi:hypothetical protein
MAGPTNDTLPHMADLSGSTSRFTKWLQNFYNSITAFTSAGSASTGAALAVFNALGGSAGVVAPGGLGWATFGSQNAAWGSYVALLNAPATRTHGNIINAKTFRFGTKAVDDAPQTLPIGIISQRGFVGQMRIMIRAIQSLGQVDSGTLGNWGLTPHNQPRTIPQIPKSGPELRVDPSPPKELWIRYSQVGLNFTSKKKPKGCKAVLITVSSSNGQVFAVSSTRCPIYVVLPDNLRGTPVIVRGTWIMGDGKSSPPGDPITVGVP